MSGRTNGDGEQTPLDPAAAARPDVTAVPEQTRSGEDSRRRGWFWHWNSLVTQYAPLIGLKGIGLLNSYTVWTDRRAESPHRGYAFPSQQSEADFYGEDRAELIAINKILVALDLIEIRKEMVLRADPQGRRWRVPHNFYRVKDHDDGFVLSSGDVLRVAELAARDRAVYRYVRRVFSPRFAPIDGDNVWHRILPEVRREPLWMQLAERTEREEARASDRTRAGHAARKAAGPVPTDGTADATTDNDFFAPASGAAPATRRTRNDSRSATASEGEATFVATSDNGSGAAVAPANNGSTAESASAVAPVSEAGRTAVARSNRTYHQSNTTTNEGSNDEFDGAIAVPEPAGSFPTSDPFRHRPGPGAAPGDGPAEAAAIRAFEEANARGATPAERKLLRSLAERFEPTAAATHQSRPDVPGSGWGWLAAAVYEAVEAGSAFVAPRRLREILQRWERDGYPQTDDEAAAGIVVERATVPAATEAAPRPSAPVSGSPAHAAAAFDPESEPAAPVFPVVECGLTNRQVWAAVLAEVERSGEIGRADFETWLRGTSLIGRGGDGGAGSPFVVGVPHALARRRVESRFLPALRQAVARVAGAPLPLEIVLARRWLADAARPDAAADRRQVGA